MKTMLTTMALALAGLVAHAKIEPELMRFRDGREVKTVADWATRRVELAKAILPVEYGKMPAKPAAVRVEDVSRHDRVLWLKNADFRVVRISTEMDGKPVAVLVQIFCPKGAKPGSCPVLIDGDGCWLYLNDNLVRTTIDRGFMVVRFNRCEVARDDRSSGDSTLLKWAWAYHRVIDALIQCEPRVDAGRIAITGHSRGGKVVLLAGATDTRIWAVGENCSGCGGSGPCRNAPPEAETIAAITRVFPYWFAPDWGKWAGRENELPFDQHFLEALIAPRKLFIRQAKNDLWANPEGGRAVAEAARAAWRLLGQGQNLVFSLREGDHCHAPEDYQAFLDFLAN